MVRLPLEKKQELSKDDIESLIEKGAPVKEDIKTKDLKNDASKKWKNINLRIPKSMLDEIDEIVEKSVGYTRTGWILQAIQEKLD